MDDVARVTGTRLTESTPNPLPSTTLYRSALGWYAFKGTAWISAKAASDARTLEEVSNHEMAHWVLAATTSYGLVQQALASATPTPWEPPVGAAQELLGMLVKASWVPQEAAATYSGLAFFEPDQRAERQARLPGAYREAVAVFDEFFTARSFEAHDQLRIARAIAARSLQTNLIAAWVTDGCSRDALVTHLTHPANNPTLRFEKIVDFLSDLGDDAVEAWAGSFVWDDRELVLSPPSPCQAIDGLDFVQPPRPPERRKWVDMILRCVRGGYPADELDWDAIANRLNSNISFAVHPEVAEARDLEDQEARAWLARADVVVLQANLLGGTRIIDGLMDPPHVIGSDAAVASSYCPGDHGVLRHVLPVQDVQQYLQLISPSATVCIDFQSLVSADAQGRPQLWVRRDPLTLLSPGDLTTLQMSLSRLRQICREPLVAHLFLMSPAWGFVLARPQASLWPLVVHPVVWPEWRIRVDELCGQFGLVLLDDRETFFADPQSLVALYRIQRVFTAEQTTAETWAYLESALLTGAHRHPVVELLPIISGSFATNPKFSA